MMIPISEIQTMHIKLCLDECQSSNPKFSAKRFNKVKAYVSALYNYLSEVGAVYGNVAVGIRVKVEEPTEPIDMTQADLDKIKEHLWVYNRPLYKFMMMFYWSGGRFKELYRLKGRKVNLVEQTYSTQIIKGKRRDWVSRTIRDVALPYWQEQMKNCIPDDYVFSRDLLQGPIHIDSHQITKRWMRWVKKPLGIEWGFYKLKTLSSDRNIAKVGAKGAAGHMGHTSTRMAEKTYQFEEQKRIHESLKVLDIPL
jgi:integrase